VSSDRLTRLLLWAPNGAGLHYSGPGMSAFRLLSKLQPTDGLDVTLAHGSAAQEASQAFSAQQLVAPINGSPLSQAHFIWRGRSWLSRQRGRFDVFYGLQAFDFTVLPAETAESIGIPAIVKVVQHNSDLADKSGWRSWLGRAKTRREKVARLSGIVAISDAIREELISYRIPDRKIACIPNGVDTDRFRPPATAMERNRARSELGLPDDMIILFVGAIVPRKRPHLLVEALGKLKFAGTGAHLILAGPVKDPRYEHAIKSSAQELGVEHQVTWTGFVRDTEPLYKAADIFALLSLNEGMPNALLEAMASGLPSVITPIPGSVDLVRDGEEGIFTDGALSSLTGALSLYIRSPQLVAAHGTAARARALAHFSARSILERHIALYKRVAAGGDAAEP
jgi:glycosyltransferase involved in cell wall biosynthesis